MLIQQNQPNPKSVFFLVMFTSFNRWHRWWREDSNLLRWKGARLLLGMSGPFITFLTKHLSPRHHIFLFDLILNRFQLPLHRKGCEDTIEVGLRIGIICRWRSELEMKPGTKYSRKPFGCKYFSLKRKIEEQFIFNSFVRSWFRKMDVSNETKSSKDENQL